MASGNLMFTLYPLAGSQPSTLYASPDFIVGTSTPVESIPVLDYDQTTIEYMDWRISLPPNYSGGGLTCVARISATTVTSGNVGIGIAVRTIENSDDLNTTAHTYDYNDSSATAVPATNGQTVDITITFSNGADMDSLAAGGDAIIRVRRNTGVASNATNDMELHYIKVTET